MRTDKHKAMPRLGLLLFVSLIAATVIACGSSASDQEQGATHPPAEVSLSCLLSGPPSGFALQAIPGIDPVPTAFDGINTATCEFSEPITAVMVTLLAIGGPLDGLEIFAETIAIEPASATVIFPIDLASEREVLSSLIPLGPYTRRMEASTVGGGVVVIQTEDFEVSTEIFLVDPPNATAYAHINNMTGRVTVDISSRYRTPSPEDNS